MLKVLPSFEFIMASLNQGSYTTPSKDQLTNDSNDDAESNIISVKDRR